MGKEVFGRGHYNETAPALIAGAGMGFPWSEGSYDINTAGYVATLTHTFTGSTVLEVIAGTNWATQDVYPLGQADWDALDYRNHLPGHRQYFPENNPNHILPDMTFAGANALPKTQGHQHRPGPGVPVAGVEPYPQLLGEPDPRARQAQPQGRVLLRAQQPAGCDVEQCRNLQLQLRRGQSARHQPRVGQRAAREPQHLHREQQQHPVDAALQPAGVLRSGQLAAQPEVHPRSRCALLPHRRRHESRSRHRLVRSQRVGSGQGGQALAAALRQRRVSLHRREPRGAQSADRRAAASPWIGAVVAGSGDINNGTVFGKALPDTFPSAGIKTAPRLGFGWDVFGDGKTAVRGGFGTSYNRLGDGQYGGFTGVISRTVSLQWTTIDDRFNAPSLENPLAGTAVQEKLADHGALLEHRRAARTAVAHPGRRGLCGQYHAQCVRGQCRSVLHEPAERPDPRLVANPTPSMIDRTTGNVLPTNLIRPNYPGRGAITERVFLDELYRNYNAIQLEVRRRLANGFAWAANYTGSVTGHTRPMTGTDTEDNEARNTHSNGSRPHNLKFTYNWMMPGASRFMGTTSSSRACSTAGSCRESRPCWAAPGRLHLHLHAARPRAPRPDRRPRRHARRHRVRSEPAEQRADVRAAVPDRVRAAARAAHRSGRHALSGHRRRRRARGCAWASATSTTTSRC